MTVFLSQVLSKCFNCGKLSLIHCSKHDRLHLLERHRADLGIVHSQMSSHKAGPHPAFLWQKMAAERRQIKSSVDLGCSHQGKRCERAKFLSLFHGKFTEMKDAHVGSDMLCMSTLLRFTMNGVFLYTLKSVLKCILVPARMLRILVPACWEETHLMVDRPKWPMFLLKAPREGAELHWEHAHPGQAQPVQLEPEL